MSDKPWKAFERRIAKTFTEVFGYEVRRSPLSGGWAKGGRQSRDEFGTKGDVVAADKSFPFMVECKRRKEWDVQDLFMCKGPLVAWYKDTMVRAKAAGKVPLLIVSAPRKRLALAIMPIPFHKDYHAECVSLPYIKVFGRVNVAIVEWAVFEKQLKTPRALACIKTYKG